jgi:hypothetical protein
VTEPKAGFKNKAKLTHMGGKMFRLDEDLVFYSRKYKRRFVTPAGTLTDLASIPWLFQSFCQVLGNNIRSAIQHDFHTTDEGKKANQVNQKMADNLFSEGMAVDQVRWSKARIMTGGVKGFQRIKFLFRKEKYNAK